MSEFRYYHPVTVRYADLDTQWHVNNAAYLSWLGEARIGYLMKLGLFDGVDFKKLPVIVADVHITYKKPILIGDSVQIATRIAHLGNKSFRFEFSVENQEKNELYAVAESVMVAYDFEKQQSIVIPQDWREKIKTFEADISESSQ